MQPSATAAAHKINSAAHELSTLAAAGCVDSLQPSSGVLLTKHAREPVQNEKQKHGFASLGFNGLGV